jgi:hypothetical protein
MSKGFIWLISMIADMVHTFDDLCVYFSMIQGIYCVVSGSGKRCGDGIVIGPTADG